MLFCILGTPSAFTAYATLLMRTIASAALGEVHYVPVCTVDEMREAFAKRDGRPVVFFSDSLDRRIAEILMRADAPTLVFLDDIEDTVGYTMDARDVDVRVGIQIYSQSAACLEAFLRSPSLMYVWRPRPNVRLEELVQKICLSFGLEASAEVLSRVMTALVPHDVDPEEETVERQILRHVPYGRPAHAHATTFRPDDRALIRDALTPYHQMLAGHPTSFPWPTRLFRDSFRTEVAIEGAVDLTGPARYLFFGPLLHLPPGRWRATLTIRVVGNWSGNAIMSDIVADNAIQTTGETNLPLQGVFSYSLDFEVTDPRHPVAIRLATKQGAIEGEVELLAARAEPVADDDNSPDEYH